MRIQKGDSVKESGNLWALILAAGEGSRIRSLTRDEAGVSVPKQFYSPSGGESLLRSTIRRAASLVEKERIVTVVAEQHRQWWGEELQDFFPENIIAQPANRGTATGILLPLLDILRRDHLAKIIVMPSDHHVESETVFTGALMEAVQAVCLDDRRAVLLGMKHESRNEDYGWIVPSASPDSASVRGVAAFIEKPDMETAQLLIGHGAFVNSLIAVASGSALINMFALAVPNLLGALIRWRDDLGGEWPDLSPVYDSLETCDFSREVLERSLDYLSVLPVPTCGWTDLGTPDRLMNFHASRDLAGIASRREGVNAGVMLQV